MYGKIFEDIFDSTLSTQGDFVTTYVFMSMIVLADEHGFVHLSRDALYERLRFPNDFVCGEAFRAALTTLESPDNESNLPYEQGKRIIPLSDIDEIEGNRGWWIVNYLHYRDKGKQDESKEQRREWMRNYQRVRRAKIKENNELEPCKQAVNTSKQIFPHTDTDTDTDKTSFMGEIVNTEAWQLYLNHRKELKVKKLTKRGETMAMNKLAKLSFGDQLRCVETTIANGWTGLFPDKINSIKKGKLSYAEQLAEDMKNADIQ